MGEGVGGCVGWAGVMSCMASTDDRVYLAGDMELAIASVSCLMCSFWWPQQSRCTRVCEGTSVITIRKLFIGKHS